MGDWDDGQRRHQDSSIRAQFLRVDILPSWASASQLLTVKDAAAYIGGTEHALQHLIHKCARDTASTWIVAKPN